MVKFILTREGDTREFTRFSREFNTYGVGEELLYPIKMNDSSIGQTQPDTNLATYLINVKEFQRSNVKIKKNGNKAWLLNTFLSFFTGITPCNELESLIHQRSSNIPGHQPTGPTGRYNHKTDSLYANKNKLLREESYLDQNFLKLQSEFI